MPPFIPTKKALGQHWLNDQASLLAICQAGDVGPGDTVLEIGPGSGALTTLLVQRAKQVVAVELDADLARDLPVRVPAPNLRVVHQDITQFDLSQLPPGYKVVANVPYYLTSNIVRLLLTSPTPPARAVLLVQKEVAERLAASPGGMSVLAVSAQLYATVTLGSVVSADKFTPPPKVDSQVVVLTRRAEPLFAGLDDKAYFRVVKAGFSEKRKTLRNSLSGGLHLDKSVAEEALRRAGLRAETRAQQLSVEDWYKLTQALT